MSDEIYFMHRTAIVEPDAIVGNMVKIWHWTHVDSKAEIGDNCSIGQGVYIGKGVKIGNNCKIQNNAQIFTGVTIEDNCFIGPGVVFTNVKHPDARIDQHDNFSTTLVKDGAVIGANATVLPGITIGENAVVGAGAIVARSVYQGQTVVGKTATNFCVRR